MATSLDETAEGIASSFAADALTKQQADGTGLDKRKPAAGLFLKEMWIVYPPGEQLSYATVLPLKLLSKCLNPGTCLPPPPQAVFAGIPWFLQFFNRVCQWKSTPLTVFVHSVYIFMVLRPHFILPTVLSAVVARGAFYYQHRSRGPASMDPRLSGKKVLRALEGPNSGNH